MRAATGGAGLAFAFDFAGVAAVRAQAVRALGVGGALVLVGLTREPLTITDGTAFSYFGQQVLGHYGSGPEHVRSWCSWSGTTGSTSPARSATCCR